MKILIIDDSSTTLSFMEKLLNELNYKNIIKANSAKGAFIIANSTQVDVILLDWNMPEMDGLELLQILKNTKKTKNIPVLMVTSENEGEKIKNAIDNGAEGYIVKPVNKELLEIRLKDIELSYKVGLK
jgi:two-component system chemotaxis response regulator CheY